jgi:hypothetical protein
MQKLSKMNIHQEDEDSKVVGAPEEGHALVVEVNALLLLRPEMKK